MQYLKPYILPFIGGLGWVVAAGVSFFAIPAEARMSAFVIIGQVVLAIVALAMIAAPFIQVYGDRRKHENERKAADEERQVVEARHELEKDAAVKALTPADPAQFVICRLGNWRKRTEYALELRNTGMTDRLKITSVAVRDAASGCPFRIDQSLPIYLERATPSGPSAPVTITVIANGAQPSAYVFDLRVEVRFDHNGATPRAGFSFSIPGVSDE